MAEAAPKLAVGDRVVYPNQGLCTVTGIEAKEVAGQKLMFVALKREEDGARVLVPEAKVLAIGVRKVGDTGDAQATFAALKGSLGKSSLDWKARARANTEKISGGSLKDLAEVVRTLHELSELRPLPTKERETYNNARHLLVTELAVAMGVPDCDAEDAVDAILCPPGKDRPKRTVEEFKEGGDDAGGGDEEAALDLESAIGTLDEVPEEALDEEPKKALSADDEPTQTMAAAAAYLPDDALPPARKKSPKPAAKAAPKKAAKASVPKAAPAKKKAAPKKKAKGGK